MVAACEKSSGKALCQKGGQEECQIQAKKIRSMGKPRYAFFPPGREMYNVCCRFGTFDNLIIFRVFDTPRQRA